MKTTKRLRELLARPGAIMAPGVADALNARLVRRHGFEAVYMTGAGTTAVRLGMPDVGLLTMTEMIDNAGRIAEASGLPLIADADNGYGGVLNVRRTIQGYERAGVAGVHLEDQVIPKRCGHLAGKQVVHARPEYKEFVDAQDGTPPQTAQLVVAAEHPVPGMPQFWLNWTKFDYLYVLFTEDEAPNPDPSRLRLVADGDRFQLYRIGKFESLNVTKSKTRFD